MRPRPDAAENAKSKQHERQLSSASMRPRPDAAENTVLSSRTTSMVPLQ